MSVGRRDKEADDPDAQLFKLAAADEPRSPHAEATAAWPSKTQVVAAAQDAVNHARPGGKPSAHGSFTGHSVAAP